MTEPVNPLPDRLGPEKNRSPDEPPEAVPDLPTEEPAGTFVPPVPEGGLTIVELPGEVLLSDCEDPPLLFETPVGALRPANDGMKVAGVRLDFDPAEGA